MKQLLSALIVGCGVAAAPANAACDYPSPPGSFPDGTKASKEELLAARKLFHKYDSEMTAYIECARAVVDAKLAADPKPSKAEQKDMERIMNQKLDAALQEAEGVKERLNKELRAYSELHPPAPKPTPQ
jgi:hypothetical protein